MTELGTDETGREAAPSPRPTAASVIAELWSEREQSYGGPPTPPPPPTGGGHRRPPRPEPEGEGGDNITKVVLAVVVVALLLGAGVGVFLNSRGLGRTSTATFVRKADAVCGPANGTVTALAKPTSYPELATAAGALVTSTDAQLAGLRRLSAPGGADGGRISALLLAMSQTNSAGRSLQDAAAKADDGATASAANQMRVSSTDATTKAQELGLAACATGMQPGVDAVVGGASGIVKAAFVAKADTICRAGARAIEAVRPPRASRDPRASNREMARYLGELVPISEEITTDLKALPVPPGDEATVSEMMSEVDKIDAKGREALDAVVSNDASRFLAIGEEAIVLTTAVDAKLDAYGLTTCGSNFGRR